MPLPVVQKTNNGNDNTSTGRQQRHHNRRHSSPRKRQRRQGTTPPNPIPQALCTVCQDAKKKATYKCPKCRALYCSVVCCKDHKVKCPGVPPADEEPKVAPASIPKFATRRATDDEELLEGWKMTEDMKKMLDSSAWLHQQLQDGGLRNLISEIVASGDPESLVGAQQKYPRLPVFLDKLLLLAGVLERDTAEDSGDEETLQECLERDWNRDDLPPALTLKQTLRKRLPEFPPVDDASSSADQDESSEASESSDDDSSANDEDDNSEESE